MTLRHFKIFVAVCDTMNMTSAAEKLFVSQSAISQAISELEKHYDIKLFERLSRKLFLTQAGQKLLSYARHIIRMNEEVENDMKSLIQNGSIRLGASVTIAAHVLPKLVSQFKRTNSRVDVEIWEDNTEKIEKMILRDQIDIGLIEGETSSPDMINRPFMDDELVLICGVNHRFAACPSIEPKELEKEEFIIREQGSGTRKTFEDKMSANNLMWKAMWTCNNADSIKMAVIEGLGVSVISKRAVHHEVMAGMLHEKPICGIEFKRKFKVIYHKNKYLTESMKQFINLCFSTNASIQM